MPIGNIICIYIYTYMYKASVGKKGGEVTPHSRGLGYPQTYLSTMGVILVDQTADQRQSPQESGFWER